MIDGKRETGTSLNSTCLTPKPLVPSVYVHVPQALSPHERSIFVTSLFPFTGSFSGHAPTTGTNGANRHQLRLGGHVLATHPHLGQRFLAGKGIPLPQAPHLAQAKVLGRSLLISNRASRSCAFRCALPYCR